MTKFLTTLAAASVLAAPVWADGHAASGDAEAGAAAFNKQCVTCHAVVDPDGNTLAGKKAKTGPNLYDVVGNQAGLADFRYGKDIVAAGAENGLTWTEETFVAYVQDPTGFLREFTDNKRARGKMTYKVRKEDDAINIYAFLATLEPEASGDGS